MVGQVPFAFLLATCHFFDSSLMKVFSPTFPWPFLPLSCLSRDAGVGRAVADMELCWKDATETKLVMPSCVGCKIPWAFFPSLYFC